MKFFKKFTHYAGIMLDVLIRAFCPKICWHNLSDPYSNTWLDGISKTFEKTIVCLQSFEGYVVGLWRVKTKKTIHPKMMQ